MRSHWAVAVCVMVAGCGVVGCGKQMAESGTLNAHAKELDPVVVLDVASLNGSAKDCGQYVKNLVVTSDDITDDGLARRVIFVLENASGQDRVEIGAKSENGAPVKWKRMRLDMDHSIAATPRVGKGEVKDSTIWTYEIAFQLGSGSSCTIDPGICIRTQAGGCGTYN